MDKRGLSPIIATMLLIAIVVVMGLIIFLWLKGINEEAITKFDNSNIKLVCEEVNFEADYSNNNLYILNTGNVPIYKMDIKKIGEGIHTTETITNGWPITGLRQGETYSGYINTTDAIKLIAIPVLIGKSEKGDSSYTCE